VSFLMNPRENRKILAYPALDFYLAEPIHGDRTKKAPGCAFGTHEFTARGIRLSEPELFVPFSYPVWPHPENRKPRMCQCAQWRFIANCADVPQLIPRIAQGNGGTR
jgi:hypothetical protein